MSTKGSLQTYLQQRKQDVPLYNTRRTGGIEHRPLFSSSITVNGKMFTSGECLTKSLAEAEVAKIALDYLIGSKDMIVETQQPVQSTQPVQFVQPMQIQQPIQFVQPIPPTILTKPSDYIKPGELQNINTLILIDGENLPKLHLEVEEFLNIADIYIIVSDHHHSAMTGSKIPKILAPTIAPNGADTFIVMLIGYFLANNKYSNYMVASGDKFTVPLRDLITNRTFISGPKKYFQVTRKEHIVNAVDEISNVNTTDF